MAASYDKQSAVKDRWFHSGPPPKFTPRAVRSLKEAGVVLNQLGRWNIRFITLTCPGSSASAVKAFAQGSPYLVHSFNRYLRSSLSHPIYYYVWELQKRGAFHLHYAVYVPLVSHRYFTEEGVRDIWFNTLQGLSKLAGVDVFEQLSGGTWSYHPEALIVQVQECRDSVASYMAKSYSKESHDDLSDQPFGPSRLYDISHPLRNLIREQRFAASFPVSSIREADSFIRELVKLLDLGSGRFKPLRNPYCMEKLGLIGWIPLDQLPRVRAILKAVANNWFGSSEEAFMNDDY